MKSIKISILFLLIAILSHIGTVYFFPTAVLIALKNKRVNKGFNTIMHSRIIDANFREIVMPNPDFLYSLCSYSLKDHPLKITATIPDDTYWSISMYDTKTNNFFAFNDTMTEKKNLNILLYKDNSHENYPEADLKVYSPDKIGIVLFRTLIKDKSKIEDLMVAQKNTNCESWKM